MATTAPTISPRAAAAAASAPVVATTEESGVQVSAERVARRSDR